MSDSVQATEVRLVSRPHGRPTLSDFEVVKTDIPKPGPGEILVRNEFVTEIAPLVAAGKIKYSETIVDGIENAPQAFLDMLDGANTGKMLVRV